MSSRIASATTTRQLRRRHHEAYGQIVALDERLRQPAMCLPPRCASIRCRAATNHIFLVRDHFPWSAVSAIAVTSAAMEARVRMAIPQAAYQGRVSTDRFLDGEKAACGSGT